MREIVTHGPARINRALQGAVGVVTIAIPIATAIGAATIHATALTSIAKLLRLNCCPAATLTSPA